MTTILRKLTDWYLRRVLLEEDWSFQLHCEPAVFFSRLRERPDVRLVYKLNNPSIRLPRKKMEIALDEKAMTVRACVSSTWTKAITGTAERHLFVGALEQIGEMWQLQGRYQMRWISKWGHVLIMIVVGAYLLIGTSLLTAGLFAGNRQPNSDEFGIALFFGLLLMLFIWVSNSYLRRVRRLNLDQRQELKDTITYAGKAPGT